ncbi:MAG: signal peptidase I [candidate division Zixibacteria bacterium]|nr:signal peptidase I [candidate division Zixibacteria bacterium]
MSKQQQRKKPKPVPRERQGDIFDAIWDNVKSLLIAVVLAMIIKTSIVEAYKIPSASMEDTLLIGDFLIANKFIYGARLPLVGWRLPALRDPEPGDVIIFKYPGDRATNYIKRCVAVEGQTVEIRNKVLYIDGKVFENPPYSKFTETDIKSGRDNFGPYHVPRGSYFMMGDNRDNSYDSRFWGPVSRDLILGEALFVHWSWEPDMNSPKATVSDPLSVPRLFVYNTYHFFERVRWSRLFNIIH